MKYKFTLSNLHNCVLSFGGAYIFGIMDFDVKYMQYALIAFIAFTIQDISRKIN